jgi:FkbM family methyltransferase
MRLQTKLRSLFRLTGYDIHRLSARDSRPPYGLDNFFPLIQSFGFKPQHIVDVGANHGHWTRTACRYFPKANYTLVEPQNHLRTDIEDLERRHKIRWLNAGCSDEAGQLPLIVAYRDDSSTFVRVDRLGRPTEGAQIMVPITTLDKIAAEEGSVPDLVKIDAEGFDLRVLAGAKTLFGKTEIFMVEAVICCQSYGNTIGALVQFMADVGYSVMDITDLNRAPKHGALWLVELAFLRNDSTMLVSARDYE